ncbi:MAG: hypothetical protein ACI4VF_06290 [Lachnospirales bacterium]
MEIFNCNIDCSSIAESQEILKELDSDKDLLLTNIDQENKKIEIQYIKPINQLITIGYVPDEIANEIFEKYSEDATIDIEDYMTTYENGTYGLVVDITAEEEPKEEEKPKNKRLPLPILIVVGALTALLTAVLVFVKLLKSLNKK